MPPSSRPLAFLLVLALAAGAAAEGFPFEDPPAAAPAKAAPRAASQPAIPMTKTRQDEPLPLVPNRSAATQGKGPAGLPAMVTTGGSLAVVLGLFFLLAWVFRRSAPRASALLPGEVFEVLGRAPLAGRQQVHLLRCGNKLLLVSVTPGGAETLTEVTDAAEVDRLAGLCRQGHPQSASAAFRQVFEQFAPRRPGRQVEEEWEEHDE
jgi:flagellar biogenesis protein FliO